MAGKRILVCSHWLEIGGAERALIGLLHTLSKSEHTVDLFLCRHSGELLPFIPPNVRLLPEDPNAAAIALPARDALKRGRLGILCGRLFAKILARFYLCSYPSETSNIAIEYSHKYTYPFVRHIGGTQVYDLVLSFLTPHYIAAHRTNGTKKIAWIHTDYQTVSSDVNEGLKIWGTFDKIAGISEECALNFSKTFPQLKDRVFLFENILPEALIRQQASAFSTASEMPCDGGLRLLSIGRYCAAKNFDNIPDICARLIQMGLDVTWYIIGFGADEALIRQKVADAGMEDRVILLGKKENPYPYLVACDLYVQPSRYEGKCVSVLEAQMLGKPVVITNYPTACSQLEDGVDGIIVPLENDRCAAGIAALLRDSEKMKLLSSTCLERDYSNSHEVEKIYRLIED